MTTESPFFTIYKPTQQIATTFHLAYKNTENVENAENNREIHKWAIIPYPFILHKETNTLYGQFISSNNFKVELKEDIEFLIIEHKKILESYPYKTLKDIQVILNENKNILSILTTNFDNHKDLLTGTQLQKYIIGAYKLYNNNLHQTEKEIITLPNINCHLKINYSYNDNIYLWGPSFSLNIEL